MSSRRGASAYMVTRTRTESGLTNSESGLSSAGAVRLGTVAAGRPSPAGAGVGDAVGVTADPSACRWADSVRRGGAAVAGGAQAAGAAAPNRAAGTGAALGAAVTTGLLGVPIVTTSSPYSNTAGPSEIPVIAHSRRLVSVLVADSVRKCSATDSLKPQRPRKAGPASKSTADTR